jgi:ATP/maltotriose-dependent transcriptional regulator MalT
VPLTEREVEVLALLAEKLSNKEIARKLSISTFTVRNHTARIYEKLNVASRAQALAQAKALHLLP